VGRLPEAVRAVSRTDAEAGGGVADHPLMRFGLACVIVVGLGSRLAAARRQAV
jgi:hypothetical protein